MKNSLLALLIAISIFNIAIAQKKCSIDTFYTDIRGKNFFVFFPIDSSSAYHIPHIKRTLYDNFDVGPFEKLNFKKFHLGDTILGPYLFSSAATSLLAKKIYCGLKDTIIQGHAIKGYVFKEIIELGNVGYALSCYDALYLTPVFFIQYFDAEYRTCGKIYVNRYPGHKKNRNRNGELVPKRYLLTQKEKKIMMNIDPFEKPF